MKFVIDTNVLLVSISSKSKHHWLYQALLDEVFVLSITNDILAEYEEIAGNYMGAIASDSLMGLLENLQNIEYIKTYYKFDLITGDVDDNKFVDCAIASNADYLVTHDTDFNVLKTIAFPKVKIITLDKMKEILGL